MRKLRHLVMLCIWTSFWVLHVVYLDQLLGAESWLKNLFLQLSDFFYFFIFFIFLGSIEEKDAKKCV